MKALVFVVCLAFFALESLCMPIPQDDQIIRPRYHGLAKVIDLWNRATTGLLGVGGSGQQASAVKTAANNFAGDVSTVSSSLNGLGTTTDKSTRVSLASKGFKAESDEDAQRYVLSKAAGNAGSSANQKIVQNTPIVLNGLQSIMNNPSDANTAKQLQTMESARNANILPSITSLTNSAFKATGVGATAQNFQATTGSQQIKATLAGSTTAAGSSSSTLSGSKGGQTSSNSPNTSGAKGTASTPSGSRGSSSNVASTTSTGSKSSQSSTTKSGLFGFGGGG